MSIRNRIISAAAALAAALTAAGCANTTAATDKTTAKSDTSAADNSGKLNIVCTIFPEYDWVREILGDKADNVEITYLLDNGVDLHSYQPTAEDIIKISECDLFIYVGGESDEWTDDVLSQAENKDMKVINLMETVGSRAKEEELKEGMQGEEEEEHDHSKEVSTFEDDEVQDRPLSDWEGDWQSAYPLVLDGSLDEAWEHKSEDGKMTAEEYKDYYTKGYKSDYSAISIHDDHIKFTDNEGKVTESDYKYTGYFIQNWSTGTKAAMYRFEAEDKGSGAPVYIEFNDHMIEPEKAEHFHIRMSDESYDAIVDPEGNWPTFFDAALTPDEVCDEVIGHDHKDEDEDEHEEEEHEHEHEHEEGEEEYDEHVWLSLQNAEIFCAEIEKNLSEIDPENSDTYKTNLEAYTEKLVTLDGQFKELADSAENKTLIFGDRFPFRYFVEDYGIDYYAAFIGCSAETEASFETITFLAQKADELGTDTIYTIEGSDGKIADAIAKATSAKSMNIAVLNSVQAVSAEDIANGVSYLSLMQQNYDTLKADIG